MHEPLQQIVQYSCLVLYNHITPEIAQHVILYTRKWSMDVHPTTVKERHFSTTLQIKFSDSRIEWAMCPSLHKRPQKPARCHHSYPAVCVLFPRRHSHYCVSSDSDDRAHTYKGLITPSLSWYVGKSAN